MAFTLGNSTAAMKSRYLPAVKTATQRLGTGPVAARRFDARYGSDVARSTQKKSAKRKGFLAQIASEGYRG